MNFEQAHQEYMEYHLERRTGERKARLLRAHQYGEKLFLKNLWWPTFGNFDYLHPEYEVLDWNRKSKFIDHAFLPPLARVGLEADGFSAHVQQMDRDKFSDSLNRDTFLTGMGWKMVHFSIDDIKDRAEVCCTLLQIVIGPYLISEKPQQPANAIEKEVLRLTCNLGRYIQPKDVIKHFELDFRTARKWLQSLVKKGWMNPIEIGGAIRYYELKENFIKYL